MAHQRSMRYIDELRDPALALQLAEQIRQRARFPIRLMEFCGGHTHVVFRFGLRQMLAPEVTLCAGPGCPVCVTSAGDLDRALSLAKQPDIILATFGDMLRVPGRGGDLQTARAGGADVRVVYSPLDALEIARKTPQKTVVFLGVGFETTAPTVAAAVLQAESQGLPNFLVLSLHKLTPPAVRAILDAGEVALDGIIGPGHVSAVIGSRSWEFLPADYGVPCAVAGFEPLDVLTAIAALVDASLAGSPAVFNTYPRSVRQEGNPHAQKILEAVFQLGDAEWRGLGPVSDSGLFLTPAFAHRDAAIQFPLEVEPVGEPPGCRCGEVLRGVLEPTECSLFAHTCTPRTPAGPCMVSAEGACAAFFKYGRELL